MASKTGGPQRPLTVGTAAPDFTLPSTPDRAISLREFRGRPVILAFYPADWSPVCGDQMALYNEVLSEFQRYGAQLLGVSVDGPWCHLAFASDRKLRFPLLADFEPKGAVARQYGVSRARVVFPEGAPSVIDGAPLLRWRPVSPPTGHPAPGVNSRALEE